jgi:hypothetical protein
MAEATAETKQRTREEAQMEWEQFYVKQGKTLEQAPYEEKQSVLQAIALGIGPVTWQALPEKVTKPERKPTSMDVAVSQYMRDRETREREAREQEESLPSRGDLLSRKNDWTEYGADWTRENRDALARRLQDLMGMNAMQAQSTLEQLLATGRSAQEILEQLQANNITARRDALRASYEGSGGSPTNEDVYTRFLMNNFGLKRDNIMKFIYSDYYREENQNNYESLPPGNVEDLAWQMMWGIKGYREWGVRGDNPLLEMRVRKDEKGKTVGDYYINESNMVKWVRDRMMNAYNFDPDAPHNYFSEIQLPKRYGPINIQEMTLNPSTYFRSKDGRDYLKLSDQFVMETWGLGTLRQWDVEYRGAMTGEKLIETIQKLFKANTFTKETFKTTLFNLLTTLPLNFENPREDGSYYSDNKLGAAWIQTHLAYDRLSDFDGLEQVFGRNSHFFTRDGMLEALSTVLLARKENTGEASIESIIGADAHADFKKAFDEKTGKVKDKKSFIKLINIFGTFRPNIYMERTVRQMMRDAIQEKLKFDKKKDGSSIEMAELIAWSLSRFSGAAALGDSSSFIGYDYNTRMFYTQSYRQKMAGWERGDYFGNPFNVFAFKRMSVDLFRAMKTETFVEEKDHNGNPYKRSKMPIEVFRDLHSLKVAQVQALEEAEARWKEQGLSEEEREQRIAALQESLNKQYQKKAGELIFGQRALEDYADNHLSRSYKLYDMLMKSRELDLEKFTHFDVVRGITFDREKFQEAVQEKFFKQIRYNWSSYGELDFAKVDRYLDQKTGQFREMPLGEALFGYQMLNREFFWKKRQNVDGKWEYVYDDFGRHVIDYHKINGKDELGRSGKVKLWKTWALMKIGAELHAHFSRHSTDPAFKLSYYDHVIEALEHIPGNIMGDEFDLVDTKTGKNTFFSEEDIEWLRHISRLTEFSLTWRWILSDLFMPHDDKGMGFGEAFGILFKAVSPT